ncbi:hypothetical protein KM043_016978 [Ampulex compressa]|nr:hypothetical protein KM043_016978 [Ampulex compressa]
MNFSPGRLASVSFHRDQPVIKGPRRLDCANGELLSPPGRGESAARPDPFPFVSALKVDGKAAPKIRGTVATSRTLDSSRRRSFLWDGLWDLGFLGSSDSNAEKGRSLECFVLFAYCGFIGLNWIAKR